MTIEVIGERIRTFRLARGISQGALAELRSLDHQMRDRLVMNRTTWFALLFLLIWFTLAAAGPPIPSEVKSVVGFVFVPKADGTLTPYGTGFFVGVKDEKNSERSFIYFVTVKHVLQSTERASWFSHIHVRLNKLDGSANLISVPVVVSGPKKNVYVHDDAAVDLAVIPMAPDEKLFDYKVLPEDMITTEKDFKDHGIGEGTEVFFAGLFSHYVGTRKNYPVVRFGRVSLITDEKIKFSGQAAHLYLIESGSFGGNSGSPVFFYLGAEREFGKLIPGPPIVKLAGVMHGTFRDAQPVQLVETAKIPLALSSMGIAAVVPAYQLHELLFGGELRAQRGS